MTAEAIATRRRGGSAGRWIPGALPLLPGLLFLALFALLPLGALILKGFTDGGQLSLDNFSHLFGSHTYMTLFRRTLLQSLVVTVISIIVGWPAAWALARYVSPRYRNLILGLVILPYITSQLLLIYGFLTLIQPGGPISSTFASIGIGGSDSSVLYTPTATILMLIYESVPTVILIMYSSAEQLDGSLLEAARTMGARGRFTFARIIWPLSTPMVLAAFVLTYVQTVGAFAEPAILGGPNGSYLGNAISEQLASGASQSFAIAMSLLLLVSSLAMAALVAGIVVLGDRLITGRLELPRPGSRPTSGLAREDGSVG